MARLELVEREVVFTQSALDRRDGVWHAWTNDPYWFRRLERAGATVEHETESGKDYTLAQRQLLVRKVPAPRQQRPRVIEFLHRKESKESRQAVHFRSAGADDEE